MHNRVGKAFFFILLMLLKLGNAGALTGKVQSYEDENCTAVPQNPLIGYAPSADYYEAAKNSMLVYIEVSWREIEPEKGVYDFEKLYEENYISEYLQQGKRAVLRIVCDVPSAEEHMDIPDWLYEETSADGTKYENGYGKGYSPNYANAVFIEAHGRLLNAIAEEFQKDETKDFLAYIEIGSLGHWGEWHTNVESGVPPLPTEEICMQYVKQYVDSFPNVKLMMRRPFLGVKEYKLGLFNDMTGVPEDTEKWLDWIAEGGEYTEPMDTHLLYAIPDFYENAPAGGEFASGVGWEEYLVSEYERTKDLIERSHMSFIGPMAPHEFTAAEYQAEAKELESVLGYKLGIREAKMSYSKLFGVYLYSITVNNKGIAPIYYNWGVYLNFYDEKENLLYQKQVNLDISTIQPQEELVVDGWIKEKEEQKLQQTKYITISIVDPANGMPAIHWNNENAVENDGKEIVLYVKEEKHDF